MTGDAESTGGLLHGDESLARRGGEACLQLVGQSGPPRRSRGHLLAGDQAFIQPTMQSRGRNVQLGRRQCDRHDFADAGIRLGFKAGDTPVGPETADPVGFEPKAARRFSTLSIKDACDDCVRIEQGQASDEIDCLLIGFDRRWS